MAERLAVPAVTEMLFAIGAGPQVVAVSSFDRYPPQVEKLQRVGALIDPDVERILSLRPDMVAIYASQGDLRAQLERAKIPIPAARSGFTASAAFVPSRPAAVMPCPRGPSTIHRP